MVKKKQEIKRVRLDIGKFLLKACLQCEFGEMLTARVTRLILSIHGLGDGFSLQVVAGDSLMVLEAGGFSGFQVTGLIEWGQKSKPQKNP